MHSEGAAPSVTGTGTRKNPGRRSVIFLVFVVLFGALFLASVKSAEAAGPCGPPVTSVIACENSLPGDPPSDWQVSGQGDTTIQGFATSMSVNVGQTESFKINTPATSYHIDILRLGWYGGDGARKVASNLLPSATLPQTQPACKNDTAPTGLVDCGNWAVSASWTVPTSAVSGLYIAHLVRNDTGGDSLIPFVVRNDASHSDILFQTDDETWEAYNTWPNTSTGNSLYQCSTNCPAGSPEAYKGASKVSYNRPWQSAADDNGASWFMYAEYPMIRFLEENGYDVSYTSGVDASQPGYASTIEQHKIYMDAGHDEYWSGQQRSNVQAALTAGVNLAFFSGNEMFWKTRWEPSIDGSNTPSRTLVTYKETHYDAVVDPQDPPTWTGSWMDPRFSPPGDGGQPQNALTGQLFAVNSGTTDITVPASYSKLRFWRNTRVASLASGQSTTLDAGVGTLGYEWDVDADNGFRPAGLMDMSSTTDPTAQPFVDYGSQTTTQSTTHHLTLYRASSGALVFGAGTVQWSWGLDNGTGSGNSGGATDSAMQQAMVNLFADMGNVQPATLMSGLTPTTQSTDTTAPTSTITSPSQGATLQDGANVTISGTAADAGGGVVAGVEVSTDGGSTWHPATTMSAANTSVTWGYSWIAHGNPTTTIKSRAVDDSGNLEQPGPGVTVSVSCPCSIWGTNTTPRTADSGDASSIEVGVQFRSDVYGSVTGIRFYKASTNTGTHIGNLWSSTGQLLATATFTGESASGWQQVNFSQPVPVNKNTTYVASYLAPKGHYSADDAYFYTVPEIGQAASTVNSPPLHALQNTNGTVNGVYAYSATNTFPGSSSGAVNYWVDPVFSPQIFNNPPGQVSSVSATAGNAEASVTWSAPTTGDPVTTYTITPYIGSAPQTATTVIGNPAPTSAVVYGLTNNTAYTFTVTPSNPAGSGPESGQSNSITPLASIPLVNNGGFENGLTGWSPGGVALPTGSSGQFHSGSASALLGTVSPGAEPSGDSYLSQSVAIPTSGKSTLSFWYRPSTTDDTCSGSACVYDWEEAQVRSTSGQTLASVFKSNSNSQTWTQVSFDMTPYKGQTVVLYFNVHQDGGGDPTWMYLDDVSVTLAPAPAAPTGVTAAGGNASATVSWTAPNNGGSAITSYTVTPYVGSTAQTPVTVTGNPPATSTTVTGLTNGTTYTFTVSATNANGTGPASSPSNSVTPSTLPGAPTAVSATAGNASATVSWTAPGSGGSAITSYTVTPYIGSTAQTPVTVTGNPPATSTTVTGLTNGTSYTFTVSATNAVGTGPASSPSTAVTPAAPTPPGAPTAVSATGGNASATVSWTAPSNGGSAITSYTVTPYVGSTAQAPVTVTGNPPATSTTVTGLTNGTAYTFTVSATNANGTGPTSSPSSSVTPSTVPGAPTAVSATGGNVSATVSWGAPSDGGSAITGYTVTPYIGSTPQTPVTVTGTPPALSTTVTGLTNGTSYTFTVSATNADGTGPASSPSNSVIPSTLPGTPTAVSATAGNASATVTWTAPGNGGSAITSYTVTPYIGSTAQAPVTVAGNPPATSATVTGLTNGTSYTFTVAATNANGSGPASSPSSAVTPVAPTPPGAPTAVSATAGNASATVSWTAPSDGGSAITSYTVTPYVGLVAQTPVTVTGNPPATSTTVTGLTNGTSYTFTVTATNADGTGPASSPSTAVTPAAPTPPGAPTAVSATAANGSAIVSWTAPNNGGSAITSYTVTPYIGSTAQTPVTVTGTPPATSATVNGLTNGTGYTFTVSATNGVGTGPASPPSNGVTPNAPPAVTTVTPSTGATGVSPSIAPTATFSQPVVTSTVSFTLQDSSGTAVAGSVSFNSTDTVATFTPSSPLAALGTYTATVSGAQNTYGTPMGSAVLWSFTIAGSACPCSIWQNGTPSGAVDANDTNAVNLGVQFQVSTSGHISGIRFYKESDNTGTHIGTLWTASGALLATGTFSNETASGWQELDFSSPVAVTAGTTYVASYHTTTGHYAATTQGLASAVTNGPLTALAGGGVYAYGSSNAFPSSTYNASNYWVDVVYSPASGTAPPVVTTVTPSTGAAGVSPSITPTATFSQPVVTSTVSFTLKDSSGAAVAGSVSFNSADTVATFTPTSPLAANTSYTATVSGAQNASGAPMSGPFSWSFTTGAASPCPCSIWQNGTPSGAVDANDTKAVNLGVQFQVSTSGHISGIRFYKESDNTGTHIGTLWSASGALLATGTFSNETASGWQELDFSSPVAVTAGTTYVASYHTTTGHYAATTQGLASAVTNGPLTALAGGGVYAYGSSNAFPSSTYNASNYWVDVVYSP